MRILNCILGLFLGDTGDMTPVEAIIHRIQNATPTPRVNVGGGGEPNNQVEPEHPSVPDVTKSTSNVVMTGDGSESAEKDDTTYRKQLPSPNVYTNPSSYSHPPPPYYSHINRQGNLIQ